MVLRVSSGVLRCVISEARRSPDREVCGLLWGTADRIVAACTTANVAEYPGIAFEIDPAALLAAHRRARRARLAIVGHFHSHPSGDALPSRRDADAAVPDGALWLIVADDVARLWRATAGGARYDRFDPVAFTTGRDKRIDRPGVGVRMHAHGPDGGPPLLESIA